MKIAVASGKGGTGKTTVSVNLFYFISKEWDSNVRLVDCDVEEPNDVLFLNNPAIQSREEVYQLIPEIDTKKCTYCKKCQEWCEFNAITIVPKLNFAEVDASLCHSCGACSVACEFEAITKIEKPLGTITNYQTGFGNGLMEGCLNVGSSMQTMLIKKLKSSVDNDDCLTILDAPPGTSCPVVETVSDADYIILVTEPTPFGLHDLKITVELLADLQKPFGVIVNKAGLGNLDVYAFLEENDIELLGEIPFDRNYAVSYSSGDLLQNIPDKTTRIFREIIQKIRIKEVVR
ncbi:MAG: P-loop NTPase [Bacteroidota bacterium]